MVWVSILTVFLGIGGLLGYCSYRLYFVWLSTDPETHKNIFQVSNFYRIYQSQNIIISS